MDTLRKKYAHFDGGSGRRVDRLNFGVWWVSFEVGCGVISGSIEGVGRPGIFTY